MFMAPNMWSEIRHPVVARIGRNMPVASNMSTSWNCVRMKRTGMDSFLANLS
ncbi:unnamed protein product [Strongylus vulgaris]|uniref:Uncharacterized protein n=1 Tax=Strongylus vulgaris TaxID=40348 RepID=A0A3P7JB20_STRVU|nr:unnamed protein product [Strongylus vulgaris]